MRGALTIFTNQFATAATVSGEKGSVESVKMGNEIVNANTDAPVEFEEIVENHDAQIGMTNVGSVGRIDILPLHVQSLTGMVVVVGVIFIMIIVFRATRRESIKKVFKFCFPGRQHRIQEQRHQEMAMEMGRLGNRGLPDVVQDCPTESVEDRIRDTVAQLNLLTMQRAGMRKEIGTIPKVLQARDFMGSGTIGGGKEGQGCQERAAARE